MWYSNPTTSTPGISPLVPQRPHLLVPHTTTHTQTTSHRMGTNSVPVAQESQSASSRSHLPSFFLHQRKKEIGKGKRNLDKTSYASNQAKAKALSCQEGWQGHRVHYDGRGGLLRPGLLHRLQDLTAWMKVRPPPAGHSSFRSQWHFQSLILPCSLLWGLHMGNRTLDEQKRGRLSLLPQGLSLNIWGQGTASHLLMAFHR